MEIVFLIDAKEQKLCPNKLKIREGGRGPAKNNFKI